MIAAEGTGEQRKMLQVPLGLNPENNQYLFTTACHN